MKKGFTLTEVLVVLIVLGILAMILIPNISRMIPDDTNIKYKKAYYTLQEVVHDIVNDSDTCQTDVNDAFNNPLRYCADTAGVARVLSTEICSRLNTVDGTNCANNAVITTTNGMQWYIPQINLDNAYANTTVRVGLHNTSNLQNNSNRDPDAGTFLMTITPSGKVIPDSGVDGAGNPYNDADYLTESPTAQ